MTLWSVSDINIGPFFQKRIIKLFLLLAFTEMDFFSDFDQVYTVSKPIQALPFFPILFQNPEKALQNP